MRNQTSFRLTTTLLPNDTTANTTTVINKLDSSGNKFYPTFTEETVVLTNDDRTIMETTRATCNNGVLTFVKRGLSDDVSATPIENRKLTWNPGTLAFITAGASDWIDKDDDITWTGDQTYTGDLNSYGKATYNGLLETKKGVKYPSFTDVAALEAYATPFGGMFATVDSTGELYRYNAVTEEWDVLTTSAPATPEIATTSRIGTVRGATDTEFNNGTATGSSGELLVATPAQIKSVTPTMSLHIVNVGMVSDTITWDGEEGTKTAEITYTVPHDGFIVVERKDISITGGYVDSISVKSTGTTSSYVKTRSETKATYGASIVKRKEIVPVSAGNIKFGISRSTTLPTSYTEYIEENNIKISYFFYFG